MQSSATVKSALLQSGERQPLGPFEVGQQEEGIDTEPNNTIDEATGVKLPLVVNGMINTGADEDYYAFRANAGDRCVFNVKAYRLNNTSQQFFQPTISLFDAKGTELARNNGFYSLDPLIDYTIETDGVYYLRLRDLLYRGNPASVYRLTMGVIAYNTYLFPPSGQIGTVIEGVVGGKNLPETSWTVDLTKEENPSVKQIYTPYGVFPFIVGDKPDLVEGRRKLPRRRLLKHQPKRGTPKQRFCFKQNVSSAMKCAHRATAHLRLTNGSQPLRAWQRKTIQIFHR